MNRFQDTHDMAAKEAEELSIAGFAFITNA
jgi:hypothetical protein